MEYSSCSSPPLEHTTKWGGLRPPQAVVDGIPCPVASSVLEMAGEELESARLGVAGRLAQRIGHEQMPLPFRDEGLVSDLPLIEQLFQGMCVFDRHDGIVLIVND